jgi:hypothetical protein
MDGPGFQAWRLDIKACHVPFVAQDAVGYPGPFNRAPIIQPVCAFISADNVKVSIEPLYLIKTSPS